MTAESDDGARPELRCPFCGAPQTDRLDIDGRRFLVFQCMFTPAVDPTWDLPTTARHLRENFPRDDPSYFRSMCDRLHLYVTRGGGASALGASPTPPSGGGGGLPDDPRSRTAR